LMRHLRSSQHNLVRFAFNQVDQASIACGDLNCKTNNLTQHLIQ
jgi:hypothetical protein